MVGRGSYEEQERHTFFGISQSHYDGPGEHLKCVAEANQILVNIHYKK